MFFKILCVFAPWKKVASASKLNWKDVPILFAHQSAIKVYIDNEFMMKMVVRYVHINMYAITYL